MTLNKEQEQVIDHLAQTNGTRYNLHKASEELQELGLVLNQFLLKPGKVDQQEIIDEIGDVKIRVAILEKMFPADKIQARIDFKLAKYKEYVDHEKYEKI